MAFLKKFYAYGFKSYAEPVTLHFEDTLIGVVGPNGSGKSNILDAIRWVLGEQSIKSLRGEEANDFIFSGSKGLPPTNSAEVILTFDNTDKKLPYEKKEVIVSRKVIRDEPGSLYFLNGEPCRLKDIQDIFIETGLSRNSLGIISQGTVQDFANAKPENRRLLFEQAAGVAKYKKRKQESLSKLEKVDQNLARAGDILKEVEKNYSNLKKQAEKANIFIQKKDELEEIELAIIIADLHFYRAKEKELNKNLKELASQKKITETQYEDIEKKLISYQQEISKLDTDINKLQNELTENINNSSDLEKQKSLAESNSIHSQTDPKEIAKQLKNEISELRAEIDDRTKIVEKEEKNVLELTDKRIRVRNQAEDLKDKIMIDTNKIATLEARIEFLNDLKESNSHFFAGVKEIINNKKSLSGVHDIVGELIKVEPKFQKAIEVALGNQIQNVVTTNTNDAKQAIQFLKNNKSGTVTFLPLDSVKERTVNANDLDIAKEITGFIGVATDLIKFESKYAVAIKNLMGNVIVAEDFDSAKDISKILSQGYRIVTLDGETFAVGGAVSGGFRKNNNSILSIENEIKEIAAALSSKNEFSLKMKKEIHLLDEEYNNINILLNEKNITKAQYQEAIKHKKEALVVRESQFMKLTGESLNKDHKSVNEQLRKSIQKSQEEISKINQELKVKSQKKVTLVSSLKDVEEKVRDNRKQYDKVRDIMSEDELQIEKINNILKQHVERLTEAYGYTEEYALSNITPKKIKMDEANARELVRQLRKEIEKLGPVNIDVVKEYEQVSVRYHELKKNYDELKLAQNELLDAIKEMDTIMVQKFSATIDKINISLNDIFKFLFGGGYAKVEYSNPEDILNSGIEVIANPPGKTITNLNLLSGGEKSMVVLSILFAVLKVNSLPLVVLDEAESQLDPGNVERFAKLLQILKQKTQFIVITHRTGTMERLDVLYGCTMQTKGVTKLISVKLQEALAFAEVDLEK